jgi:hypothetical protein
MGWGSVRSTVGIRLGDVGKTFFYEARVDSGGLIQVGWGTKRCRMSATDGIGDDRYPSITPYHHHHSKKRKSKSGNSRLTIPYIHCFFIYLFIHYCHNRNSWAWDGLRKRIWHAGGSIFFHHTPLWQTVRACADMFSKWTPP